MTEFIVLYHAPQSSREQMKNMSPEDMKTGMAAWMKWAEKCGEHLIDMGAPLDTGIHITKSASNTSSTTVGGYSILHADSMDAAKELLKGHPHLEWGSEYYIEVHEKIPLPC